LSDPYCEDAGFTRLFCFLFFFLSICDSHLWSAMAFILWGKKRGSSAVTCQDEFFLHNIYLQPCQYQGIDFIILSYCNNFCTLYSVVDL
jgi:hypothetical protein